MTAHPPAGGAGGAVASGFRSLDDFLGGGLRREDLVVLAGDVGSGKSALALAVALRAAGTGSPTVYLSGEMSVGRVQERAVALEARVSVDELRRGRLDDAARGAVARAAAGLRELPLVIRPMAGADFAEVRAALDRTPRPELLVVDSLQLAGPPRPAARLDDRVTLVTRALKALALEHGLVVLATAQLPGHRRDRPDPRPTLDDLGGRGAVKQTADLVLMIYREEMYRPGQGVEGATELVVAKNRNGATGFVDLYFYPRCMRFEDVMEEG